MAESGKGNAGTWVKWALVTSVSINLLILGAMVGARAGYRGHMPHHDVGDVGFGLYTTVLDREDRRALREAFLRRAPDHNAMRREAREDFRAIVAALRANPYDPAPVAAVLTEHEARTVARLHLGAQLLTDRLASMPPLRRAELAERIEAALARASGN